MQPEHKLVYMPWRSEIHVISTEHSEQLNSHTTIQQPQVQSGNTSWGALKSQGSKTMSNTGSKTKKLALL